MASLERCKSMKRSRILPDMRSVVVPSPAPMKGETKRAPQYGDKATDSKILADGIEFSTEKKTLRQRMQEFKDKHPVEQKEVKRSPAKPTISEPSVSSVDEPVEAIRTFKSSNAMPEIISAEEPKSKKAKPTEEDVKTYRKLYYEKNKARIAEKRRTRREEEERKIAEYDRMISEQQLTK